LGFGLLNVISIEATKWHFITKSKIKNQNAKII